MDRLKDVLETILLVQRTLATFTISLLRLV
jgi:hypothetical protein